MKKLILLPVCFLLLASYVLAQQQLDPNQYVNIQIASDTLANGTHDPAKTVYQAAAGQVYVFDGSLNVNFDLTIEGTDNTWIYNNSTPPYFIDLPDNAGAARPQLIEVKSGGSLTIKNAIFSGLANNGEQSYAIVVNTAGSKVTADNCVFSDMNSFAIRNLAANSVINVTNCIMLNNVRLSNSPYGGMLVRIDGKPDSVLIENNTVINAARLLGNGGNFFNTYFTELHNTYLNSQINGHELHWYSGIQANNIFYNWSWRGRLATTNGYEAYFTTWDYFKDVKNNLDSVALYNGANLFYLNPKFTDYYKSNYADTLLTCLYWNADVDSTINADNNFTIGKNYGDFDPQFANNPTKVDSMLKWLDYYWLASQGNNVWPDWRIQSPVTYDNSGQPVLNWPPTFDLSYSNMYLQTAGTDGLPLGDLNWFPTQKATFLSNQANYITALQDSMTNATWLYTPGDTSTILVRPQDVTAIGNQSSTIPAKYYLSNNYPNPFNPSTVISFGLPQQSEVTLTVYNVLGQKVFEFKKSYSAGQHDYNFNASQLSSGVYIYSIHAVGAKGREFAQSKKMMLLK